MCVCECVCVPKDSWCEVFCNKTLQDIELNQPFSYSLVTVLASLQICASLCSTYIRL